MLGVYHEASKIAFIQENTIIQGVRSRNRIPGLTTAHEYGQAVDYAYVQVGGSRISENPEFLAEFETGIQNLESLPDPHRMQARNLLFQLYSEDGRRCRIVRNANGY